MIPWLLVTLWIVALPIRKVNVLALSMFTFPSLLFYFVADYIEDSHYIIAAMIDLAIIFGLSRLSNPTKLVAYLSIASLASIVINFFGWIIYMLYLYPSAYELAGVVLYAVAIALILRDGPNGDPNNNRKNRSVRRSYTIGSQSNHRNYPQ